MWKTGQNLDQWMVIIFDHQYIFLQLFSTVYSLENYLAFALFVIKLKSPVNKSDKFRCPVHPLLIKLAVQEVTCCLRSLCIAF